MSSGGGHEEDDGPPQHHEEHEGGHGEPWLMSYADMMTLLFGFFVLLYSFEAAKNSDDTSMIRMRRELSQYFGGAYVNPLTKVAKDYEDALKSQGILKDVSLKITQEGLEITFQSTVIFSLGQADLNPEAIKLMSPLIKLIKESATAVKVKVEGYTDDNPISSGKFPSNWELSGARASTVLRQFEAAGFDPNKLTALGYGSTRPAFPNRTATGVAIPENQSRNRRVVIIVTNELEAPKEKPESKPAEKTDEKSAEKPAEKKD